MQKTWQIARNEILQLLRKKDLWIGLALYFILDLYCIIAGVGTFQPDGKKYGILFMCTSLANPGLLCIVYTIFCSNRLIKEKKDEFFDIFLSCPNKKSQYYWGKTIGDLLYFIAVGTLFYLFDIATRFARFHFFMSAGFVKYIVLFYFGYLVFEMTCYVIFIMALTALSNRVTPAICAGLVYSLIFSSPLFSWSSYFCVFNSYLAGYWSYQIPYYRFHAELTADLMPQKVLVSAVIIIITTVALFSSGMLRFCKRED